MNTRLRNARILTFVFVFLMVFITVFSFITIDKLAKDAIFEITRDDLKGSATIIAAQIPGDTFAGIRPGDESTPEFASLREMLDSIRQSDPSIRYIYTMRRNGNAVEFVVDADYEISADGAPVGEIYPDPNPDLLAGFSQPSVDTGFATDKWGTTLSGYAPIRDGSGRIVGLVGVDMDSRMVIERMQYISTINFASLIIILVLFSMGATLFDMRRSGVEIMIERANEKLNILNSIIRHDIFNTLTALEGYEEMAEASETMPELLEKLTTISALTQKIQQQIAFTRDFQNLGLSMPQWQNVQEVISRESSGLDLFCIRKGMDFAHLECRADPLFGRAFHHLIENSVRHGETLTMIKGYYRRSGSALIIIIEDDGIGIPAAEKEAIFNRKFYKNTGLGLFLAKEILSMTNFSISERGTPGKGARFEIVIPRGMWRMAGVNSGRG